MLDGLMQQFLGGNAQSLEGPELHGGVNQMLQQTSGGELGGVIGQVLGSMGSGGFGQSVGQAAAHGGPGTKAGILGMLTQAVEQGGGNPSNLLQQFGAAGVDPSQLSPQQLEGMAQHVHNNHSGGLQDVLTNQLQGGNSGLLSLLGNPMVRQIGMQLASRVMGG